MSATNNTRKNAPAIAPKGKAPAKATKPAAKVPAPKAPAPKAPAVPAFDVEKALARIDALERTCIALSAQCETLEKIIVGVQTAQLTARKETAPAKAHTPARETAPAIEDTSFDAVLKATAEHVRVNYEARDVFNEKIIPQTDSDFRVYLTTPQHRTFKLAAKACEMSLVDAVNALANEVNA